MADHDEAQDYKANGPTEIGFRTDGTGIENGVVAFGKQIGVHGISVGGDKGSFFCGVKGESPVGIGVQGQATNGPGVVGISDFSDGVSGSGGGQGVGVKGSSKDNDGIVGESSGQGRSGVLGFNTLSEGTTFGVGGSSHSPDGAGVFGFSEPGVGVKGESKGGYGGHFGGGRAPLRLQPADDTSGRPRIGDHKRGELFVDKNGDLFFCKGDGTPGTWFRVQLIPA